jgi:hypothetical protein
MTRPILYQGSTGAIGDVFLSSHPMMLQHYQGTPIYACLDKNAPEHVKDLYRRVKFLKGIIELEEFTRENYIQYCRENNFDQCLYLEDIRYVLQPAFFPLNRWFNYDFQPTLEPGNYFGFQVASSTNYERPAIPHLDVFVEHVINYPSYKAVFIGTSKDEKLFNELYPGFREKYQILDEHWRFGKDSLFQTMSNIRMFSGMVTFSSWTAYAAALQGVPTLEFWSMNQWILYTPMIRKNLGDPVHYVQDFYLDGATPYMVKIFQYLKDLSRSFYGSFD